MPSNRLLSGKEKTFPPEKKTTLIYMDGYTDSFSYETGEICSVFLNAGEKKRVTIRLMNVEGKPVYSIRTEVFNQVVVGKRHGLMDFAI